MYAHSDIHFRAKYWINRTMDRALLLPLWPIAVYAKWQNVCFYGLLDFRTRCSSTGDGSMRFVFSFDFNIWSGESIDTPLLLSHAILEFKIVHRIFHISKYLLFIFSIVLFIIRFILLILRRVSVCRLNLRFLSQNLLFYSQKKTSLKLSQKSRFFSIHLKNGCFDREKAVEST